MRALLLALTTPRDVPSFEALRREFHRRASSTTDEIV
jgi:hypothetical protein